MSYRRPYYEYDANLCFRGIVWVDLREASQRVIFDSDLANVGVQAKINFGRDIDAKQRAHVDAGVFPKGEHPKGAT